MFACVSIVICVGMVDRSPIIWDLCIGMVKEINRILESNVNLLPCILWPFILYLKLLLMDK